MKRVHYIDWLRVLAVLLLIPFHSARVFDIRETFYAKNAQLSQVLTWFIQAVDPWHMPLLFLLAGASSYLALGKRSRSEYVAERRKRLLPPLVFGLLVIVPPQGWYAGMTNAGYAGSFLAYWPTFFIPRGDLSGYWGGITPAHLWFILYLYLISVFASRFMVRERDGERCKRLACALGNPVSWPAVIGVLAVASLLPGPVGKNPFYYVVYFALGFVAMADERFMQSVERLRVVNLALGIVVTGVILAAARAASTAPRFTLLWAGYGLLRFAAGWLLVLVCLGFGRHYLDREARFLSYASEASYPFYILHQTVIVAIAFYVVQLPWGVWPKYAVIALLSLIATTTGYELVRRVGPLRYLFGMKPLPKPSALS